MPHRHIDKLAHQQIDTSTMKHLLKNTALLLLCSTLAFCSKKDDDSPQSGTSGSVTPKVSLLQVASDNGSYSIDVAANTAYTQQTDANWIKLSDDTDYSTVKFEVRANEGSERRGSIKLFVQNVEKAKIEIYQKARLFVTLENSTIEVGADEAEHTLNITDRNTDQYTLSASESWITFPSQTEKNKVTFKTAQNDSGAARSGKISLKVEDKTIAEITVTQRATVAYLLPFVEFGKVANDIKEFEKIRKSTLKSEKDLGSGTQLTYTVKDPLFGEVQYVTNLRGFQRAGLYSKEPTMTDAQKADFQAFLLQEGFEKISIQGFKTTLSISKETKEAFVHKEKQVLVQFMADAKANHYAFSYYPVQQKNFATFSAVPSLFKKGATDAEVAQYEAANGGTLDAANSPASNASRNAFLYKVNKNNVISRTYFVGKATNNRVGLFQTTFRFSNATAAFFAGLDGEYYPTKEFSALLLKEGFEYSGVSKNGHVVYKKGKDFIAAKVIFVDKEAVLEVMTYYSV